MEASRASSGNIKLDMANIDIVELVQQTNGEFEEKYAIRHLDIVTTLPNEVILIEADGRRLWRVLENLYNNAFKYAMEGTRVYVGIEDRDSEVVFSIKNVSATPLNISPDELTERFVRRRYVPYHRRERTGPFHCQGPDPAPGRPVRDHH